MKNADAISRIKQFVTYETLFRSYGLKFLLDEN